MGKLAFNLTDDLDTRIAKIEKRLRHLLFKKYAYMNRYKDENGLINWLKLKGQYS